MNSGATFRPPTGPSKAGTSSQTVRRGPGPLDAFGVRAGGSSHDVESTKCERCGGRRRSSARSRLSGAAGHASSALPCRLPAGLPVPAGARYGSGGGRGARAEVTGGGTRGPRNVFSTA
jgi:hypothetical protein